jgi:hypothetical protein
MSLSFTIAAGSRQRSYSRVQVPRNSWHILLSQSRDSPNLEGQVPVFISPRNRVAQLYPQALGFFFVTSYDPQGYGGGILTRLHTGHICINNSWSFILRRSNLYEVVSTVHYHIEQVTTWSWKYGRGDKGQYWNNLFFNLVMNWSNRVDMSIFRIKSKYRTSNKL